MRQQTQPSKPQPARSPGTLRKDALGVLGAVAMAMAFMGPATSVAFNTGPAAAGVGYALPFAIFLALIACLLVANTIAAFARKLPTAGFVYTFNTRGFGRDGGFLSGWLLLLGYGMVGPMLFAAIGYFTSDFIATQFHVHVAWEFITLAFVLIIWGINALGISRSAKTALVFLVLEVGVMLSLFSTILAKGGAQGLSLGPLNPLHSLKGVSGLGIGMLWGILMFIGFGHSHVASFVADGNPFLTLATRYWGFTWLFALTVLNSQFANLISGCNAFVRVLFSMGREGILPRLLGTTDRSHIPQAALAGYMIFSLAYALGVGSQISPLGVYAFAGTVLGLAMVICYILMSAAVIRFYRRDYPAEFSPLRHGLFPVVGAVLMLLPIYGLVWPVPAYPSNLVPWIVLGWLAVGGGYLWAIHRSRPELLTAMGRVFGDTPETRQPSASVPGATPPEPA